jgi:uracil-DNA glycosylase
MGRARRTVCASRSSPAFARPPAWSTSTRRWNPISAFRPPATASSNIGPKQGVLLLNSVLTVQSGMAASHQGRGWERFTDAVIRLVNAQARPVVFMLWGSYAQKKAAFVDSIDRGGRHLVLKSVHPSPLSAYNGFFGSQHFSKANAFLKEHGEKPIDWALPPLE